MEVRIYFWSGHDRWTGRPDAVETVWKDNRLIRAVPVTEIPEGATKIRMLKGQLRALLHGEGQYDQPWHLARVEAVS